MKRYFGCALTTEKNKFNYTLIDVGIEIYHTVNEIFKINYSLHSLSCISQRLLNYNMSKDEAVMPETKGNTAIRRRTKQACDKCSVSRTKCDGLLPCARCASLAIKCEYSRERKKRGKGSERFLAKKYAKWLENGMGDHKELVPQPGFHMAKRRSGEMENNMASSSNSHLSGVGNSCVDKRTSQSPPQASKTSHPITQAAPSSSGHHENEHIASSQDDLDLGELAGNNNNSSSGGYTPLNYFEMSPLNGGTSGLDILHDLRETSNKMGGSGNSGSNNGAVATTSSGTTNNVTSASNGTSVSGCGNNTANGSGTTQKVLYPALDIIKKDISFIDPHVASDLLEVYFTNSLFGKSTILKKSSLIDQKNPRKCSPALLTSILLVSVHTTDHPSIKLSISKGQDIGTKFLDLTLSYLVERFTPTCTTIGDLDDVITYIHLGIVTSASERKGASMKWWDTAKNLARYLKLNQESPSTTISEETREEMRRAWWLLFLFDRHLGLCYNHPLYLSESECLELFQPLADEKWISANLTILPAEYDNTRSKGPPTIFGGGGLFGTYLPLMVVLGNIIDIHFMELSDPCLMDINELLKRYVTKKIEYLQNQLQDAVQSPGSSSNPWYAYASFCLEVFYILLEGFWDPVDIYDNIDTLAHLPKFQISTQHAIRAATHMESVLSLDPDLRLIPFFIGIHILLSGIIPLCVAAHLMISDEIRHTCEVIIRAHEVCIVTLSTDYQKNFRMILRGTIQPYGASMHGVEDNRSKWRKILLFYRWNAGGKGIAF